MHKHLYTVDEVTKMIKEGRVLLIAGDELLLTQLPDGEWVGGTIPYFMTRHGGMYTTELLYVTDITNEVTNIKIETYDENSIHNLLEHSFENGFSYIVVPALTKVLEKFALEAPNWDKMYVNPVVGWVTGVRYEDFGAAKPKTFAGNKAFTNKAVVLHAALPEGKVARTEIINVYEQGDGDEILFGERGFGNNLCTIDGETRDLYQYFQEQNVDETLPLVANYAGANINVGSIWNKETKRADLFAPVFPNTVYKVAKTRDINYPEEFREKIAGDAGSNIIFSCNCLFNYINFQLEGRAIENVTGPVTFGEIAYHLLNQTFVYLVVE
jgi:hypothetical protein